MVYCYLSLEYFFVYPGMYARLFYLLHYWKAFRTISLTSSIIAFPFVFIARDYIAPTLLNKFHRPMNYKIGVMCTQWTWTLYYSVMTQQFSRLLWIQECLVNVLMPILVFWVFPGVNARWFYLPHYWIGLGTILVSPSICYLFYQIHNAF